jgi:hypothetical protein
MVALQFCDNAVAGKWKGARYFVLWGKAETVNGKQLFCPTLSC